MRFLFLCWLFLLPISAHAENELVVPAQVISVYDGDTFTVDAHIWPGVTQRTTIRIVGIDTPELHRSKCPAEKELANQARERLRELMGDHVILQEIAYGKYARRMLARVYTQHGEDVGQTLIQEGLARPYEGGRRGSWCDGPN